MAPNKDQYPKKKKKPLTRDPNLGVEGRDNMGRVIIRIPWKSLENGHGVHWKTAMKLTDGFDKTILS